jgi:predicted Zn-dependent protease with MMP-like domain
MCSAYSRASACRSAQTEQPVQMPKMIWLYRRPILNYWSEREDTLGAVIARAE